ncbi:MAG: thymidylate kinase-like protein [Deltaproteobacteria bacterium]|nr:thymidylate kinase-like protein [Deltaproteobacteria bacterium]MBW2074707.1 thymidylate kinase-like protein [Deltaproteobacteria bacterium]
MTISNHSQISGLLTAALDALESAGVRTCILHGYEGYPDRIPSDVDFVVLPQDLSKLPSIFCRLPGLLVQCLQHEATAYYYVLSTISNGELQFLHLDVSGDYRRNGRVFLSAEEILTSRRQFKKFWIPAPDVEFTYYLIKRIAKGSIDEEQSKSLISLYQQNPGGCRKQIYRFWSAKAARELISAVESNEWSTVCTRIAWFRKDLLAKAFQKDLVGCFAYWKDDLVRCVKRVCVPTGLHVVILGADGSGKSSLLQNVEANLAPAFRKTSRLHLRPSFLKARKEEGPVTNPHNLVNYSPIISLLKLGYFSLDYILGYFVKIYLMLVRSTLVLFDRYYHDILVDPKRYRYGGPMWLARWVGKVIPKPDLFILLDAPPEVLQARKQEVPFEETARQRQAYLKLVRGMKNGVVVDASRPLNDVVAEVNRVILDFMAERTKKRFGL